MAKVTYDSASPYRDTVQTSWFLSIWEPRLLDRDGSDVLRILESRYNLRPDLLSYDLYGTPNYWWVFAILNPNQIKDPIYDFKTGTAIYVPTASRLGSDLGA